MTEKVNSQLSAFEKFWSLITAIGSGTIIRTALLILALINQALTAIGYSVLPINNAQLTELISITFTTITAVLAWWKNNSFTQNAITADKYKNTLKEGKQNEH